MIRLEILLVTLAGCSASAVPVPQQSNIVRTQLSDESVVEIFPPLRGRFVSAEHAVGEGEELGDALGGDCIVVEMVEVDKRMWARTHKGDGLRNEDWFGWRDEVLAPFDGVVVRVTPEPPVNEPGIMGKGPAAFVAVARADGVNVVLAHLTEISASAGDKVVAGQRIGLVGNNGQSRHPHVHLGAWKAKTPLQIRFNLAAMAKLRGDE